MPRNVLGWYKDHTESGPPPAAQSVQLDRKEIIFGLQHDDEFFIQFYMSDLEYPIPAFHLDVFQRMVNIESRKDAFAIPRGHNKTTLAKLAAVRLLLFSSYRFTVYVSNTSEVSQAACRDIVGFLQSDNHVAVFGPLEKLIWREGEGVYVFNINVPFVGKKKCILRALGAGQQVRGINIDNERPELGIIDDLEDDDNTATDFLIKKLKNWVYGALFKAFNAWQMKIIWIGNLLSDKSLLNAFCNPNNEEWNSIRLGCFLEDGSVLWPDLWPYDKLIADYKEYKAMGLTSRWFAEMMNLPIPAEGGLISSDEIKYYPVPNPRDSRVGFVTIDPAISDQTWANFTSIVVHVWVDERWVVCEHQTSHLDPLGTIDFAIQLLEKWGLRVIGIESIAYQAALKWFFEYILLQRGLTHIIIYPTHKTSRSKVAKLAAWAALIKNGTYYLPENDYLITEQLLRFDPTKKNNSDDIIDACSQGVEMIEQHLPTIMETYQLPHMKHMEIETAAEYGNI